jgi:peptide/nickel transport system permease protein
MLKYIFKRLIYMVFIFFVMSIVLFSVYNLIPGDPARVEVEGLKATLKPDDYQRAYEEARQRLGLDEPKIVRYGKWMGGVLTGDLGQSSVYKKPVTTVIKAPMGNTIFINIFSIFLALVITIPLGIICAVKKKSIFDNAVQVLTIVGYSIPVFIFSLIFIYIFAVKLRWFPVSGMNTPNFSGTGVAWFLDRMYYLALPLIVMTVGNLGGLTRYVRAAMIEALRMDYIRTARAKGLKEKVVIYSHAWRNALLPVITLIIGWVMSVFSGSLVIESIFNLNGMGKFYIAALTNQDYNVALAVQLFYMLIALAGNLIIDLSYGLVDPRVRVNN